MSLYFVAALTNPAKILAAAKALGGEGEVHELAPDKFLINFSGTSIELSQKLGIAEGENGTGVIVLFQSYHGRAPKSVWEWVAQKQGAK